MDQGSPSGTGAKTRRAPTTEEAAPVRLRTRACVTLRLVFCGQEQIVTRPPRALSVGSTVIGRVSEDAHNIYLEDRRCSRVHAVLELEKDSRLKVSDAGSRNGTFVNGRRVSKSPLSDGDILRVGDSLFVVRRQPEPLFDAQSADILGQSPQICELRSRLQQAAAGRSSILLQGESGTGKELAAHAIHTWSRRRGAFIAVNCSAIPANLAESQLFGHVAGAFTGATAYVGFFRAAEQGTLFLDELGELPSEIQPKLLRVVEDGQVRPVGAVASWPVDVRLICATNRDLPSEAKEGRFRGDLLARLGEVTISLPPLRARREDILLLLRQGLGGSSPSLSADLTEAVLLADWPFNVRELNNFAKKLADPRCDLVEEEDRLRAAQSEPLAGSQDADENLSAPTREELDALLLRHHGNIAAVARALRGTRKQVYRWLTERHIDVSGYRGRLSQ